MHSTQNIMQLGKVLLEDVLEQGALRVRSRTREAHGGTGKQGQARKGPAHQARKLRGGAEVGGSLKGS